MTLSIHDYRLAKMYSVHNKKGFVDLLKAEIRQGVRNKIKCSGRRIQMHGLLGDRFLRRFAGFLKRRRSHHPAEAEEKKPEAEKENIVGPDSHATEKSLEKEGMDSLDQ